MSNSIVEIKNDIENLINAIKLNSLTDTKQIAKELEIISDKINFGKKKPKPIQLPIITNSPNTIPFNTILQQSQNKNILQSESNSIEELLSVQQENQKKIKSNLEKNIIPVKNDNTHINSEDNFYENEQVCAEQIFVSPIHINNDYIQIKKFK